MRISGWSSDVCSSDLARPLTLSARSGTASASVPLADLAAPGAWRTYGVPLKCFADQGVDMEHPDVPFAPTTSGKAVISLATVQLGTVADQLAACPNLLGVPQEPPWDDPAPRRPHARGS